MNKINKFRAIYVLAAMFGLNSHVASAWTFISNVDSDSANWSKYNTYSTTTSGADRYINYYDNMFVRVWAAENSWSSAGRTVSIPNLSLGYCQVQITHTGAAGTFYVRDSATYTNLSPVVKVDSSNLLASNLNARLNKVNTNFMARSKNVFARFYMLGGREYYGGGAYAGVRPYTAYLDDLVIFCQ